MRVFVSSVIRDLEAFRAAASDAIETLGHTPIRAEDFGASPASPQQACLAGVREADLVVLLMGSRYGAPQRSGLSATHEEYREARDDRPVLVFVQQNIEPEVPQAAFINEVQGWEQGHFTAEFSNADELRTKVTRALHDYDLTNAASPLDEAELASHAQQLASADRRTGNAALVLAIASGPVRSVLRPAELENRDVHRFLLAEALTGAEAVLDPTFGTDSQVRGDAIELIQSGAPGWVHLDESANLVLAQSAIEDSGRRSAITSLIDEVIAERIARALRFCAHVLDHVDAQQRISHVAPVAAVHGAGYLPWRTRAEHERSPNEAVMGAGRDLVVATLTPPVRRRPALTHDTQRLAEDLAIRLRREAKR